MKALTVTPVLVAFLTIVVQTQAPVLPRGPLPAFEVASVKANPSLDGSGGIMGPQPGGRFLAINASAVALISYAYNVISNQGLTGVPAWARSERFDVNAKAADPNASVDQLRLMLQRLLMDRFRMTSRVELQEQPTYALVMARADRRLGPNLRQPKVDCDVLRREIAAGIAPRLVPPPPTGPVTPCTMRNRPGTFHSGGTTMETVAMVLYPAVQRPVIDKTGLMGSYEFELDYAPSSPGFETPEPSDLPSIFTALEEQLGLKLIPERNRLPVVVVLNFERPTGEANFLPSSLLQR